jgi:hypothetical protein
VHAGGAPLGLLITAFFLSRIVGGYCGGAIASPEPRKANALGCPSALGAAYRRRGTMKFLFVNSGTFAQAVRLASDSN